MEIEGITWFWLFVPMPLLIILAAASLIKNRGN